MEVSKRRGRSLGEDFRMGRSGRRNIREELFKQFSVSFLA
jgi:hypothetical protein